VTGVSIQAPIVIEVFIQMKKVFFTITRVKAVNFNL
jgi:hypothetical protein